jgi:hypothetical protein
LASIGVSTRVGVRPNGPGFSGEDRPDQDDRS